MRKFKKGILSNTNKILALLISILGISTSCEKIGVDEPVAEYGVPHATFIIRGNILSSESNSPINGIQITSSHDTAFSDENGIYLLKIDGVFPTSQLFNISYSDIDGDENGNYQKLDTTINFTNPQFINEDGWYAGETETEADIKLDPEN